MRLAPYPGDRLADGGEPVARARRVKRRPREQSAEWPIFPEAMLRTCPGYRLADGGEPVARARRVKRRPREQRAEWLIFPEAILTHLSGLPARRRLRTRSPAKRSASRGDYFCASALNTMATAWAPGSILPRRLSLFRYDARPAPALLA